ncbi:hypothetical protein ACLI09_00520 [Flavobacterium sp. RHBU_24]|uniref:hypothetical protein n=1 Tax=Flavobacterium sp. RHBU_24 TaxID=3391185 RepID=UPI00398480A8
MAFITTVLFTSCGTPRHTVEIQDYILVSNGKQILGKEKGLTAFIFENNPQKVPFVQFAANKYGVGQYVDVSYWVTVDGYRFKVFVYDSDELQKYFDMGQFMVTQQETTQNIVGSTEKFIGLSMITDANEDCLDEKSLFNKIATTYLKSLKDEYYNL